MKPIRLCFIIFYFCIGCLLNGQSTGTLISKKFKHSNLEQVFKWLSQNYEISIAYDNKLAKGIPVHTTIHNLTVEESLQHVLRNTALTFLKINAQKYLIGPKSPTEPNHPALIEGLITDRNTGEPLPFANIYWEESQKGTVSNTDGYFQLQKMADDQTAIVSYIGYLPIKILLSPEYSPVKIQLEAEVIEFDSITILEEMQPVSVNKSSNAIQLKLDQIQGSAPFLIGPDVLRSIQMLPGVNASNDLSANLEVRGGSANENMILLDQMTLYNIDHFYGVFSMIQPEIVDQVNLYKNDFPIEYSGYASSIVEINSDPSLPKSLNGQVHIDLLTARAMANLPLSKNISFSLAGRTTYQDIANAQIFNIIQNNRDQLDEIITQQLDNSRIPDLIGVQPSFHFRDAFIKGQWEPSKSDRISVQFFSGMDQYDYNVEQRFRNTQNNNRIQNSITNSEVAKWNNQAIGVNYSRQWSAKLSSTLSLSHSSYSIDNEQKFGFIQERRFREDRIRERTINQFNEIEGVRFDWKNTWDNTNGGDLTFGYGFVDQSTNLDIFTNNDRNQELADQASQNIFYAKQTLQPFENLSLGAGLSTTYYSKVDRFFFSPRVSATYTITDQIYLKSSWAIYNQFLRQIYYEDPFGENQTLWVLARESERRRGNDIPPLTNTQWMIGGHLTLDHWNFDIELYQRESNGVLEYALRNPGFNLNQLDFVDNLIFTLFGGEGDSKGIDFLLQSEFKHYNGWVSYSLSSTTHTFANVNGGNPYPAQDDRRHQLKWVNIFQFGDWSFSGNYIFASGRPYLDISEVTQTPIDRELPTYESNIVRLKDYHRIDLGMGYQFDLFQHESQLNFSIINLLNRQNVRNRQFAFSLNPEQQIGSIEQNPVIGTELQLLERIFNVSFGWKF